MKSNGYTLMELLVVMALLAIFVVLVAPSAINMYKQAKENTFVIQSQNIFKAANNQSLMNELLGETVARFYYAGEENFENKLDLSGSKQIYYDIQVENEKIIKIIVSNNNYSLNIENTNGIDIADIKKELIKEKGDEAYISVEVTL